MKVDWRINHDVLSGGIIGTDTFVDIAYDQGIFEAILGRQFYNTMNEWRRLILVRKKDNSLMELMNWAEEELKFRSSHE